MQLIAQGLKLVYTEIGNTTHYGVPLCLNGQYLTIVTVYAQPRLLPVPGKLRMLNLKRPQNEKLRKNPLAKQYSLHKSYAYLDARTLG